MRQKEQVWWVSATVLSLSAFSFFAGLGLRGLHARLSPSPTLTDSLLGYPRLASAAPRIPDPDVSPATLYFEVLQKLHLHYVEKLPSNNELAHGSVEAMLNSLNDPNTRILSKGELDSLRSSMSGEFSGLGAVLTIKRYNGRVGEDLTAEEPEEPKRRPGSPANPPNPGVRTITVVATAPGSPAEAAGLLPGDHITEIDGHWIAPTHLSYRVLTQITDELGPQDGRPRDPEDKPENRPADPERDKARKEADEIRNRWKNARELPTVMQELLGQGQGEHELTIERGRPAKTLKVKVTLRQTKSELVQSRKLDPTTGYLRLLVLTPDTRKQAESALTDFQNSGVKNLVLDLRESTGGSLEAARDIAGMLIGDAKFAVLKERGTTADRKTVENPVLIKNATVRFKPSVVSVLVDGGTAGSSELLAAALRTHLRARLVGTTTFGDGTEQEIIGLDDGSGFSITRAKMITADGVDYDGKGLKADVAPQGDPVDAAVKALTAAPSRPGTGA